MRELYLTRGYQSSVEPVLHFGLGEETLVDTMEVRWPDGSREIRTEVPVDQILFLDHADASLDSADAESGGEASMDSPPPLFREPEGGLQPPPRHRAQISLVDPALQPYPAARDVVAFAAGDLDRDGLDDFLWGGSGGEASRIYTQGGDGRFRSTLLLPQAGSERQVAAAAILDADGDGLNDLWLATQYGTGQARTVLRHRVFINSGDGTFREPEVVWEEEVGRETTLAPGDYDGDGQMDMFVGYRTVPGTGPAPGSRLFRGEEGTFRDVTAQAASAFSELRTLTDALWTDLDGDGSQDLVVAGEWAPLQVFSYDGEQLREVGAEVGLATEHGWWQSLAAADFDGDGDQDLVAGNLGLNHPYNPTPDRPFRLFVGDFDGDGEEEAVPAYYEGDSLYPWFGRGRLTEILPWVQELFPTLDAYGRATLPDILGEESMSEAIGYEVGDLRSLYLENRGAEGFRSRPLPREVQISPVFGIAPADFDEDGFLDLVLSGNLYAFDPMIPRLDGGVGVFLRGDGTGAFGAVSPMESGLWLNGPARGTQLLHLGAAAVPGILSGFVGEEARLHVTRDR
jgi:hypothetical protein